MALALALAACAEPGPAARTYLALDCAQPFEAQTAALAAQPGLVRAPTDPAEPYLFFSSDDQRTSYLITRPDAPGHPAIMMQRAQGGEVRTTGCRYGDQTAYDELLAYLESLKTWTRKGARLTTAPGSTT